MKATEVRKHYNAAVDGAIELVEEKARKILREHPNLEEFVMAMGVWFFTEKSKTRTQSEIVYNRSYIDNSSLALFISQWDEYLKITGWAMRFTADGPVITEW